MSRISVIEVEKLKRKFSKTSRMTKRHREGSWTTQPAPKRRKKPVHHEDIEARALWRWAQNVPELREHLYHIPNGGRRGKIEASLLKAQGARKGVNDYHLPLARGGYIGLWIELKATPPNDAPMTEEQKEWQNKMNAAGHLAWMSKGWIDAKRILTWYLAQPPTITIGARP